MKIYNLDEALAEFDRLNPSTDCVCERIVASEQVHAVTPLKPALENPPSVMAYNDATARHIEGLKADADALNDEIEHLRAIAQRAQQREAEAVKRCYELLEALAISASAVKQCEALKAALNPFAELSASVTSKDTAQIWICSDTKDRMCNVEARAAYLLMPMIQAAREALKGQP